jgi:acyl-CoA thioesterase II
VTSQTPGTAASAAADNLSETITGTSSWGSAREFLGVEPTSDRAHWRMPVTRSLSTWARNLFGGAGLGAAVEVMEAFTGRPVIWATAQYLSFAKVGSVLSLDVEEVVRGNATSQARVVVRHDDHEVLTVNAALGSRDTQAQGSYAVMPDVPRPLDSPLREHRFGVKDSINEHIQARIASGRPSEELDGTPSPDGRSALWARLPGVAANSAAGLAVLGDFVPFGIGQALGLRAGGSSLDNTIRMVRLVPTEWVLLDIRIHAVHNGFGHGLVHLWAEDGTLMATASQSTSVKFWDQLGTPPKK